MLGTPFMEIPQSTTRMDSAFTVSKFILRLVIKFALFKRNSFRPPYLVSKVNRIHGNRKKAWTSCSRPIQISKLWVDRNISDSTSLDSRQLRIKFYCSTKSPKIAMSTNLVLICKNPVKRITRHTIYNYWSLWENKKVNKMCQLNWEQQVNFKKKSNKNKLSWWWRLQV